jgi:hypothetical protein
MKNHPPKAAKPPKAPFWEIWEFWQAADWTAKRNEGV